MLLTVGCISAPPTGNPNDQKREDIEKYFRASGSTSLEQQKNLDELRARYSSRQVDDRLSDPRFKKRLSTNLVFQNCPSWREKVTVVEKFSCELTYQYQININLSCSKGTMRKALQRVRWKLGDKTGADLFDLDKTISFNFKKIKKEDVLIKPDKVEDEDAPKEISLEIGNNVFSVPTDQLSSLAIEAPDSICQ